MDVIPSYLTKVSDLIHPTTYSWNISIIQQCFSPVDAERILQIPLPPFQAQDKIVWFPAKDGEFSIKRAYWFSHNLTKHQKDHPTTSSLNNLHSVF